MAGLGTRWSLRSSSNPSDVSIIQWFCDREEARFVSHRQYPSLDLNIFLGENTQLSSVQALLQVWLTLRHFNCSSKWHPKGFLVGQLLGCYKSTNKPSRLVLWITCLSVVCLCLQSLKLQRNSAWKHHMDLHEISNIIFILTRGERAHVRGEMGCGDNAAGNKDWLWSVGQAVVVVYTGHVAMKKLWLSLQPSGDALKGSLVRDPCLEGLQNEPLGSVAVKVMSGWSLSPGLPAKPSSVVWHFMGFGSEKGSNSSRYQKYTLVF